jgi:2-C-methyl-D-erythritol 4-phosphate cytidylyltransferase
VTARVPREDGAEGTPLSPAVNRSRVHQVVTGRVERENLFAGQTPQIFRRDLLVKACAAVLAAEVEVTDKISAIERIGGKVTQASARLCLTVSRRRSG